METRTNFVNGDVVCLKSQKRTAPYMIVDENKEGGVHCLWLSLENKPMSKILPKESLQLLKDKRPEKQIKDIKVGALVRLIEHDLLMTVIANSPLCATCTWIDEKHDIQTFDFPNNVLKNVVEDCYIVKYDNII